MIEREGWVCGICRAIVPFQVVSSAAGWYIGAWCACGQEHRETDVFRNRAVADGLLVSFERFGYLVRRAS